MDEKISENYAKYYAAKSHIPYVSTKSICTAHKYKVTNSVATLWKEPDDCCW